MEEERRILRIEARRQLEASLDDERKVQMTEAKRLIDEAVEEEKKFLTKKLENALEDEKKLSDKKLEAALEQATLANKKFPYEYLRSSSYSIYNRRELLCTVSWR